MIRAMLRRPAATLARARRLVRRIETSEDGGPITAMEAMEARLALMQRETRFLISQLALPPETDWRTRLAAVEGTPAANAFPFSAICRQEDFETRHFAYWTRRTGQALRYHRKLWEFVFIAQALYERGLLTYGRRGLGFGVGREPLAALFAAHGCEILATDMAADAAVEAGWTASEQHAAGLAGLNDLGLCPELQFRQLVRFQTQDMNAISPALSGFDFCWSACALEHLGSIEHGLDFIENSLAVLRPGGVAVHTTEFNLSSNDDTVERGGTVLFRRRDIEALAERLARQGHQVAPLDLRPGDGPVDRYIDVPPYRAEPHLRLLLEGYAATSVGLIVRRAG